MFWRLLLESFVRQRRRKALAGVAILLGTTAVTAMLALATTIGDRIHRELAVYGANLVVTPAADALEVKVGGVSVRPANGGAYLKLADIEKLKSIFWANNITGISPELTEQERAAFLHSHVDSVPVTVKKLWFDHEFGLLHTGAPQLHPWWKLTGQWPAQMIHHEDFFQVVVGSAFAAQHNLHLHDSFSVAPEATASSAIFPAQISGIVTTGDDTDNDVLMPLIDKRLGFAESDDLITRVEVSARTKPEDGFARKDPDTLTPKMREIWYCRPYANSIAYQIREAIPGARAEQVRRVEQSEGTVLERISGLMWLVSGAALLAAGFAVSAAMATAILERRAEIGLMRSLGAGKGAVASLFYAEIALLAVVAGGVGYLAGSGLAAWLGGRIFGGAFSWAGMFNPVLLPVVVGLGLVVAMAGSTPSIRAALRMNPSAILREDG